MKNPLYKRITRELKQDFGKYLALFLFLTLTIGFCSGFLVAGGSMRAAYNNSFEKYTIENGHFTLYAKADDSTLNSWEQKENVEIYELFYKDKVLENEHTVRVYKMRSDVNKIDLMKGEYPQNNNDILIDRLYAANNHISIGDDMEIDGKKYQVCGLGAFSDYSALFKNNTDMMFDANKFTVSVVTDSTFENMGDAGLKYTYAWTNNDSDMTDAKQKDKAEAFMEHISREAVLTDFVARQDNQAIMFTGQDMGSDKLMIQWLLYIVIVILAFAFAVTIKSTIEQEASVIGTLRASGYVRSELLKHYIILPLSVTVAAAVVGNILGYTAMKYVVKGMYYNSYSLPTYKTMWNMEAFILTTIVPGIIILIVNVVVLCRALSLKPLQFLRHDLKRSKSKGALKLPEWKFISRFRARVILQNVSTYLTMAAGIFLASVFVVFGMMFSPLLDNFRKEVQNSKIAEYQYILKAPIETKTDGAEKYSVCMLVNGNDEEITIYGIEKDSRYIKEFDSTEENLTSGSVILSDGMMEKYSIKNGNKIMLSEKYEDKDYEFTAAGSYHYPAAMAVFMTSEQFYETFDVEEGSFSGYFSDKKIDDIDDNYVASIITEHDLTIMADQLQDSMGMMFSLWIGFAVLLFVLMIYLLSKLIIEKNANSISMIKILGYSDREAGRLYNTATTIVVVVSLIVSIPASELVIRIIYYAMMMEYSGWLTYYIAPWLYPAAFLIGVVCYAVVCIFEKNKIKKIPLSETLKNME